MEYLLLAGLQLGSLMSVQSVEYGRDYEFLVATINTGAEMGSGVKS